MQHILEIKDLRVWFKTDNATAKAVNDITFHLSSGESLAIVGESGCGKSVTALSIMRLLKHDILSGGFGPSRIAFRGRDLLSMTEDDLRKIRGNSISMIFQEPMTSLNPVHMIGSQLAEPLILHQGLEKKAALKSAEAILKEMGIPSPEQVMKNYPHQLSGGMKQRAMIGMALACRPEILIADEPTTALDVTIQSQILQLIRQLQHEFGTALILITHDLGIVSEMADRIIVMYGGKIMETGTCEEIFNNPAHPYTRALLKSRPSSECIGRPLYTIPGIVEAATADITGCRFSRRCENSIDYCRENEPATTRLSDTGSVHCHMFARECSDIKFSQPDTDNTVSCVKEEAKNRPEEDNSEELLRIENLQVWFPLYKGWLKRVVGHVRAVDDFSVNIRSGTTLGLVGESGCGKTTLGQSLVRLVNPTGGKIFFKGEPVLDKYGADLKNLRRHIQIVFQDPFSSLSPSMLISEIVSEGLKVHNLTNDEAETDRLISKALEEVGLDPEAADRYPHQFSGGQRQRISLARALILNPELIILDESTSALDVSVQAQILNLLKEFQKKRNLTYLFISHDLGVIEYLADYVAVMYLGRIVESGTRQEIFENPRHPYTISLIKAVPKIGRKSTTPAITGDMPSPVSPPCGCHFHPRCPVFKKHGIKNCNITYPLTRELSGTHSVRCYWEEQP